MKDMFVLFDIETSYRDGATIDVMFYASLLIVLAACNSEREGGEGAPLAKILMLKLELRVSNFFF